MFYFQAINCLLRWLRKRDDSIHGLFAGFLAGWSMMFYKGPTLALYTASKLLEVRLTLVLYIASKLLEEGFTNPCTLSLNCVR